jgi:hypothetical protein
MGDPGTALQPCFPDLPGDVVPMSLAVTTGSPGRARQVQAPLTHAELAVAQSVREHGVPSGTASPLQLPLPSQTAFCEHASPVTQFVPAGAIVLAQSPVEGAHADNVQGPGAGQAFGMPVHVPPLQSVLSSHRLLSEQTMPFVTLLVVHFCVPVPALLGSHTPNAQSVVRALQSTAWLAVEQAPVVHVPAGKQPSPPQAAPLASIVSTQLPVVESQLGAV